MKFLLTLFILSAGLSFTQNIDPKIFEKRDEIYFQFNVSDRKELDEIGNIISIDNVKNGIVYAYANQEQFNNFLKRDIRFKLLPHPGDEVVEVSDNVNRITGWDVYPTYDAYISMMNQFQTAYPSLCKIIETGTTVQGRKLLFAKISDNVNLKEEEPQFMYAASMHGDETTGYVLMLRLIDSLLYSYGTDSRITQLLDSTEIWIQPLSNPDGTYYGGNGTVTGARRYNQNSVDLNRNFPDPVAGPHPDNKVWQPETIVMMNLLDKNSFILSANFHGGAEVVNYPWDTWAQLHPDDTWFKFISREFADTVHRFAPSTYMNGYDNGITNGYAWYRVTGGRQDYMTYFSRGREVTIEISDSKLLNASLLPAHWYYLKNSLFNYIEQTKYGIRGKITDSNGNPLKARILLQSHDFNNSEIKSDSITGMYYRMISPGSYTLVISSDSFITKTISGISITNYNSVSMNVQLEPTNPTPVELAYFISSVNGKKVNLSWSTVTELNNMGFEIERRDAGSKNFEKIIFIAGKGNSSSVNHYVHSDEINFKGVSSYRLFQIDFSGTRTLLSETEAIINPGQFTLEQNYPNPFNPFTKISFRIPFAGKVVLKLYDLLGREVKTMINETLNEGGYDYVLDGSQLQSGLYIYRIQSDNQFLSRKLLFIK